ncbi:MAG TPA: LacI family DNA-binding transcriptional regulator [Opitutaceae bacterium]|nr:LacI family DNA-binding transcriptional regulator [Opitutaceae bacterium]
MPVTLRVIAAAAGVSKSTVSLALSGNPRTAEATRRRVAAVAERLGYRANAAFTRVMHQIRAGRSVSVQSTLGLLHGFPEKNPHLTNAYHGEIVRGAEMRATERGYRLDHLWLREPGMTEARLGRVIRARGISGLFIPRSPEPLVLSLDWDSLPAVTMAYTLVAPRLSRVSAHNQQAMFMCLEKLCALGYRRIGLQLDAKFDDHERFQLAAPFLWYQRLIPPRDRVRLLPPGPWTEASFRVWLKRGRPDAIIVTNDQTPAWLTRLGLEVPRDVGVVIPDFLETAGSFSRVNHRPERIGAAAIDLLIGQLHRNESGLPRIPKTMYVDVEWYEGTSLRRVGPPRLMDLQDLA